MYKIAIIDDDPDIVEAVTMLLESKGYGVVSAVNVETGTKLVETENPDLILLDVMMDEPDDGFFLAQKFRRDNIKTPIIMFTSVSKTIGMDFVSGDIMHVDEFVEKPISPDEMIKKVEKFLKK